MLYNSCLSLNVWVGIVNNLLFGLFVSPNRIDIEERKGNCSGYTRSEDEGKKANSLFYTENIQIYLTNTVCNNID